MNDLHLISIAMLMIFGGLLGGIVNHYLTDSNDPKEPCTKPIVIGIGASFLVPLFLNTISSSLINDAKDSHEYYFVFLGFCVFAAIYSKKFIETISDKILKDVKKTKLNSDLLKRDFEKVKTEIEPIVQSQTEVDTDEEIASTKDGNYRYTLSDTELNVLATLRNVRFSYRGPYNIAKDSRITTNEAKDILIKLKDKNLVSSREKNNKTQYFLTENGRRFLILHKPAYKSEFFDLVQNAIEQGITNMDKGGKNTLPQIIGPDIWEDLEVKERLSIGKKFYKLVEIGEYNNLSIGNKDSKNHQLYIKI